MTRLLISVDPGKLSGFAMFDFTHLDRIQSYGTGELDQFTVCQTVDDLLEDKEDVHYEIVMEKFTVTAQTGKNTNGENWSSEIIGAVRYLAKKHNVRFTEQTPAEAKSFVPNDRLKAIGVWHVGGEGHARDALRHGVLYLVKHHGWRPEGLLAT